MKLTRATISSLLVLALVLTAPLAISAQAQVADTIEASLDLDQLRDYRRQRLSVKIQTERQETIEITGNRYKNVFGQTVTRRTVQRSGDTYKEWIPYKGFDRTTEVEFFKTAGYPELAREAEDFHVDNKSSINNAGAAFGFSFSAVGGGFAIAGALSDGDAARRGRNVGLGFLGAGALILLLDAVITSGGEHYELGPPMRFPADQVSGIAGEYNRKLYRELREVRSEVTRRSNSRVEFPGRTTVVEQRVREALSLPGGARKVLSAETAGLQEGDVIVSVDGSELEQEDTLSQILSNYSSSATLKMEILREGESQTVSVALN